jgi:hypothetical protein
VQTTLLTDESVVHLDEGLVVLRDFSIGERRAGKVGSGLFDAVGFSGTKKRFPALSRWMDERGVGQGGQLKWGGKGRGEKTTNRLLCDSGGSKGSERGDRVRSSHLM